MHFIYFQLLANTRSKQIVDGSNYGNEVEGLGAG